VTLEVVMRVTFLQSGGVVGAVRGCELDSRSLAPDEARELEALVVSSGITESGEFLSPAGRDLRLYEIRVENGMNIVVATFDDRTLPERARPLLSLLRRHAKSRKGA
jgi:hypothetical protein